MTGAEVDEADADDGAIYAFWAFIEARQDLGRPPFDLENLESFRDAVIAFEEGALS